MKFVKVDHERCMEPDGRTYGFVPDDWTQEQFEEAVFRAKKNYQAAVEAYMEELKAGDLQHLSNYWHDSGPNYKKYPDKTVREVQEAHAKVVEEKKRRKAVLEQAQRNFSSFLKAEGVTSIWDAETDFEIEVGWGHQHGTPLDYREPSLYEVDKQGAATVKEED